ATSEDGRGQRCNQGCTLELEDTAEAQVPEVEETIEFLAAEAVVLGGSLDLDESARLECHQVHIDVRDDVLGIVQVEPGLAGDDADTRGGDQLDHRVGVDPPLRHQPAAGIVERDGGAGDGGGAGAAVGHDDVAVDEDGALAEGGHVDGGAQGAADEALDLLGAAADLAALTAAAGMGGARQHGVLGGDPAGAGAAAPGGQLLLHAGGAEHGGMPGGDQAGALRIRGSAPAEGKGAQRVGAAAGTI